MRHHAPQWTTVLMTTALLTVLGGCASLTVKQPAALKAKGTILVVPLREPNLFYFDSEAGIEMASFASAAIQNNMTELEALDYRTTRGAIRALLLSETIAEADWVQIGLDAGADYVLYGTIDLLRWTEPENPSMPRGVFTITYYVMDVAQCAEVLRMTVSSRYPYRTLSDDGMAVFEMTTNELKQRTYHYAGELLAETFYEHRVSKLEKLFLKRKGK